MRQRLHELGGRRLGELRPGAGRLRLAHEAVDAAVADALVQLARQDLVAQVGRDIGPVLDDASVHVDEVEAAVRPRVEVHRAEALVGGRDEIDSVRVRVRRADAGSVLLQDAPRDEVGGGVADEGVAAVLGREVVAAVDDGAAGGGAGGDAPVLAENPFLVAPVDARIDARRPERLVLHDLEVDARALARVSQGRVAGDQISPQDFGVRVVEEAAQVVLGDAPLAPRARRAHGPLVAVATEPQRRVGAVDPVVHRRHQAVGGVLDRRPAAVGRGHQRL